MYLHELGFEQTIRIGKWKAVRHGLNQPIELCDLDNISEQCNLAVEYPDIGQKITEILQTVRFESKEFPIHHYQPHISLLPLAQPISSIEKLSV